MIPDLPPGETCLPEDLPCEGFFELSTDAQVESVGTCSVILGTLIIVGEVTTVEPLSCLREVSESFVIEFAPLQSTAGLEALEVVDVFGAVGSPLTSFGTPNLQQARVLFAEQNKQLTSLDFPSLTTISEALAINFNPLLPSCDVEALYEQTSPPELLCENNLLDACGDLCPG